MKRIAFYDTKPYDKIWFDKLNTRYEIEYYESKLRENSTQLAAGFDAAIAFVNDVVDRATIDKLCELGVQVLALRCAGFNNVDVRAAYGKLHILRVPAYSPYAVAEHAMALLLTLNRKIHKAYARTREFNFSLTGLMGFDLHGKTVGVIGTGRIGRVFVDICRGFGMRVLAYDPYPAADLPAEYTDLDTLFQNSDIIALHCPLTEQTYHMLDRQAFRKMKKGAVIINTSRGALIDSTALLEALNDETVSGAGLDVYEEEYDIFYEDFSNVIVRDDVLSLLISRPNVILTSHQGFLTREALENIARTTLQNLDDFFAGAPLPNEVCYLCMQGSEAAACRRTNEKGRCF
jgi:D-lactate dehydrogenase